MNDKLYEMYANDELWDKTSCPFGTQTLSRKAYDIRDELYGLDDDLTVAKIKYIETKNTLHTEMQWKDEDYNMSIEVECLIYVYEGYIYNVKMAWSDGCAGYTMTREPQFNKKYL